MTSRRAWTRQAVRASALAATTVAVWWLWLGWDTEYQTDPVTGTTSGPYTAWQVAGCVLSLAALAVAGGRLLGPVMAVAAISLSFTTAWSAQAAATDDSGLWLVGSVLVGAGTAAGTALVSTIAWATRGRPTVTAS